MKDKKLQGLLDSVDLYGGQANQFTIKGRTNLHSQIGVLCSVIHYIALFSFALLKFGFVAKKHNPDISVFTERNQHLTKEEGINLDKINFQFAIAVTDSSTGQIKHDPKFVDWSIQAWNNEKGTFERELNIGMHPCTQDEYSKFYPRTV